MSRSRYFSTVLPIYAILYVMAILAFDHNGKVASIGAMGFALLGVIGATVIRGDEDRERGRNRNRNRRGTHGSGQPPTSAD